MYDVVYNEWYYFLKNVLSKNFESIQHNYITWFMETDTDSCKNVSLEEYLESIGRDPDDQYRMTVEKKAQIPFNILYAGAV